MIRQKKLGLYWGHKGLALVEVHKNEVTTFSSIPFESLERDPVVGIGSLFEDPRLLDLIQTSYRAARFSTVDTYLSLPSKDIIIRWFAIPWMKPAEIQGVVAFEARKYIPFPLEELFFTYYPSLITRDGVRQVGISFVAIRKTILKSYLNVLRQSGLNVVYTEPAPLSLVRSLVSKKIIDVNHVTAILNFFEDNVEIIISSLGHLRFIRDFKMPLSGQDSTEEEKDILRHRMFNEVKMSLDFYARQQPDAEVRGMIAVVPGAEMEMLKGLSDDLGLKIRHVEGALGFDKISATGTGHVLALGAALSGTVAAVVDLDLSEDQGDAPAVRDIRPIAEPLKPKVLAFCIGVCLIGAAIFSGAFFWSGQLLSERQARHKALAKTLGEFADKPIASIQSENRNELDKIKAVKALRLQTDLAAVLKDLAGIVPEGIWFQGLDYSLGQETVLADTKGKKSSSASGQKLTVEGYAYLDNTSAEFQVINDFVRALESDESLSARFKTVQLKTTRKTTLGKIQATYFVLGCE